MVKKEWNRAVLAGPSYWIACRNVSLLLLTCFVLSESSVIPSAQAQTGQRYFDSLHAAYAYATQDTEKSDILLKLATALEDADTATAMSYATQSFDYA